MQRPHSVSLAWLGRFALVVVASAAGIWLSIAVTLGQVIGNSNPASALAWSNSASAQVAMAQAILEARPNAAQIARARRLSEAALLREPVNPPAARTLALVVSLSNDGTKAARLMHYSETLSRRDFPTQFWLIQENVERNDIPGALRHYDRALRSSASARGLLLPILVQASADPSIAQPLARLLATRPVWWEAFADKLVAESNAPRSLAHIALRLRLSPDIETERDQLRQAMGRLVQLGAYREAYALYRQARGAAASQALLRDGSFDGGGELAPLEWQFTEEPGLNAVRQPRPDGTAGMALSLVAENGRDGRVARQFLVLPAGRYELSAVVGNTTGDTFARPVISVTCAAGQTAITSVTVPQAPPSGTLVRHRFQVPSINCGGQWISISIGSGLEAQSSTPAWIDSIALRSLSETS